MLYGLFEIIQRLLDLASFAIFVYCILTWVAPAAPFTDWLRRLLEPITAPFRSLAMKIALKWGARIDLTYWFALIAIRIVSMLLLRIQYMIY